MKQFLIVNLLVIVFFQCSCTTSTPQSEVEAFRSFWNPVLDRSKDGSATNISRFKTEGSALVFEGTLIEGDCARVKENLERTKIDKLIVNSQGGLVSEGLCIADLLATKGVKETIVKGVCWSSCANYLFLGAENKVIARGTVGFHGNSTANIKENGVLEIIQKTLTGASLTKQDRDSLRTYLSRSESSAPFTTEENSILQKMTQTYEKEKKFFESRGIPQHFFDMTQLADKGQKDGKSYLFLMPSATYFARELNINIQGNQDTHFIEKANSKFPVGFLYKD